MHNAVALKKVILYIMEKWSWYLIYKKRACELRIEHCINKIHYVIGVAAENIIIVMIIAIVSQRTQHLKSGKNQNVPCIIKKMLSNDSMAIDGISELIG